MKSQFASGAWAKPELKKGSVASQTMFIAGGGADGIGGATS
ncbi:MAG: hypothetical protein PHN84_11840 [Desulfuromonadaceae bacterium]|nr:hypothetical protein [Desulfuromonadaceae bacterium]MDD2856975.1 hypothetical protein [Desulfuromonadaceae bacterium]